VAKPHARASTICKTFPVLLILTTTSYLLGNTFQIPQDKLGGNDGHQWDTSN